MSIHAPTVLDLAPREPIVNVYTFVQDGCDYCAKMKLELAKFQAQLPSAFVVQIDETFAQHTVCNYTAKSVPTTIIVVDGEIAETFVGVISATALTRTYKMLLKGE